MNHCKTCRWWGPNQPEFDAAAHATQRGRCSCPKVHHAICRIDEETFEESLCDKDTGHVLEDDEAGVRDGSGYFAALFTGPDFGCLHHEPRQAGT